jgi:hypothetical protein
MRQRGRKSAANLVTFPAIEHRSRLEPPPSLSQAEQEVFTELASHVTHLRPADVPLLASLAQAILLSRQLARDPARVADWEKATRAQAMLSTKLRLTPQSRTDSRAAGRRQQPSGDDPW